MLLRDAFVKAAKHFAIYGIGTIASRLATLFLVPVYTRSLSVEDYGVVSVLTITVLVFTPVAQLGLTTAVLRFHFDYEDAAGRKRMVGTALMMLACFTVALCLAVGVASGPLSRLITGSEDCAVCLWLIGAMLVTDSVFALLTSQLRAEMKSRLFTLVNVAKVIVTFCAGVLLVVVMKKGVEGAVAANAIASAVMCLAVMPALLNRASLNFSWDVARRLLVFGLPIVPTSLSATALASADRYLLLNMSSSIEAGKAVVAVYSLIYMYSNLFRIGLDDPLRMVWLPQMMSVLHSDRANEFYSRTFGFFAMLSGFVVLFLVAAYPTAIRIVTGQESYVGSSTVVWMILLSLVFIGSARLLDIGIALAKKTGYYALFYAAAAVLNVGLNFILIPRYGMLGAAVATIGGASILPVCYYYAGQRFYKVQYEWKLIGRNAFVFLALSACLLMLPRLSLSGVAQAGATVGVLVAYFPLMILFGVLRVRDIRAVIRPSRPAGDNENTRREEEPDSAVADSPTD